MIYNAKMCKELFGKAVVFKNAAGIVKGEESFSEYTSTDWLRYWKAKAKQRGIVYISRRYKDSAVLKKLVSTFNGSDIKLMMDYIWDSDAPMIAKGGRLPYKDYGIFLLSDSFLNGVYNGALQWRNGETSEPVRGWKGGEKEGVKIDF